MVYLHGAEDEAGIAVSFIIEAAVPEKVEAAAETSFNSQGGVFAEADVDTHGNPDRNENAEFSFPDMVDIKIIESAESGVRMAT